MFSLTDKIWIDDTALSNIGRSANTGGPCNSADPYQSAQED